MSRKSDLVTGAEKRRPINIPFPVVPDRSESRLTEKQLFDYRNKQEQFARWLLREGKNVDEKIGYAESTASRGIYRIGLFHRFVWENEDEYVPVPSTEHADEFISRLAYTDKSQSHKKKCLVSVKEPFDRTERLVRFDEYLRV